MLLPMILAAHARTLNLRFPAAPVSTVVATIAKASGQTLSVDPAVAKEIVALRLEDVTPQQAMEKLAKGLDATWKPFESGSLLIRNASQLSEERANYRKYRLDGFQRTVAKRKTQKPFDPRRYAEAVEAVERLQTMNSDDANYPSAIQSARRAGDVLPYEAPSIRLAERLSDIFSPDYAEAFGESRLVFHTSPNARQRRATPAMINAFSRYLKEEAQLQALGCTEYGAASTSPSRDLEVILEGDGHGISGRLRILDRAGKSKLAAYCVLYPTFEPAIDLRSRAKDEILREPGDLYREAQAKAFHLPGTGASAVEPLMDTGACLLAWAAARHESLVAVLGDDLITLPTPWQSEDSITAIARNGYSVSECDGTISIVPLDRTETRRVQADRSALAEWLRVERQNHSLGIADYIRLGRRLPLTEDNPKVYGWLYNVGVRSSEWNTPLLGLVYGLPRGRSIPLRNLLSSIQSSLRNMVLTRGPGDHRTPQFVCGTGMNFSDDLTDWLPIGVFDDAVVRVDETREPGLVWDEIPKEDYDDRSWSTASKLRDLSLDDFTDRKVRVGVCHRLELTISMRGDLRYQDRIDAVENLGPSIPVLQMPLPLLRSFHSERRLTSK